MAFSFVRFCCFLFHASGIILYCGVLTSAQASNCQADACCSPGGYTEINDPRRSTDSKLIPGVSPICDRALTRGWYRFTSFVGDKMPTSKVDQYHCGTDHPIWMKGIHPLVSDGTVDRKACINFFDLNDGCHTELNMKVRNCTDFYVYYLGPAYSCPLAYCAGELLPH